MAAYPVLVLAVYRRSGALFVGTLLSVAANPLVASMALTFLFFDRMARLYEEHANARTEDGSTPE